MEVLEIQTLIYEIRGQKIMLDFDLAKLYSVETRALNQAVKRNINRFPTDFMFQLTRDEWDMMLSQFVITSMAKRPRYAIPYAFTEQGLAMLSGVLNSEKAVAVNIVIMRTFVYLRTYALTHKDLSEKIKLIEAKYDQQFSDVYEAINFLLQKDKVTTQQQDRTKIGFKK